MLSVYDGCMTNTQDMTYSESAQGVIITLERALAELDAHGMGLGDRADFLADMGTCEYYDAGEVLGWLGY